MWGRNFYITIFAIILSTGLMESSFAFYQWENSNNSGALRGLLRGYGIATENPEDQFFYERTSDQGLALLGRLMLQSQLSQTLSYDINMYQTYIPNAFVQGQGTQGSNSDVERSALLEWSFSDDRYTVLAFDRINLRWSYNRFDVSIGRQPINLATTFYFTPNDLFSPFAAQSFFRVYKPGVDAIRTEVRLGELSQLSFFHVFGYGQDPLSDTGWSNNPDPQRASDLLRLSTVYRDFEWAMLAGSIRKQALIGTALQGELFKWLGIRFEANILRPKVGTQNHRWESAVGIEHRWESSFELRAEYFYHGSGVDSAANYTSILTTEGNAYFARRYIAVGGSYELTPLLMTQAVLINNLIDQSRLLAINGVYSLSDESELALNISLPIGKKPNGIEVKSEFGLYPRSILLEIRQYF